MSISIAMTTYNGIKYLEEQLRSIIEQTLQADEVIIADDCSTDGTQQLVKEFITNNKLENWALIENTENKGWMANFDQSIKHCHGEYIFFADQDDIWNRNKIETMTGVMNGHREINALSCKAALINQNGQPVAPSRHLPASVIPDHAFQQKRFSTKFQYAVYPGCCLVVRKTLIDSLWDDALLATPYDARCWKCAMILDSAYVLGEALVQYRIHDSNASSPFTKWDMRTYQADSRKRGVQTTLATLDAMAQFTQKTGDQVKQKMISNIIAFNRQRLGFMDQPTVSAGVRLLFDRKYYLSWKMLFGDLLLRTMVRIRKKPPANQ